jgi:putative transposase
VNGRKRHVLVDTTGLVLSVVVHEASLADRDGAQRVVEACPASTRGQVQQLWVDAGYQGDRMRALVEHVGWNMQIVRRPSTWSWVPSGEEPPPLPRGFQVLPRRWVVERTFAWLGRWRRLSKDYEELPATTEAWIYLAMSRLMLARLTRADARLPA